MGLLQFAEQFLGPAGEQVGAAFGGQATRALGHGHGGRVLASRLQQARPQQERQAFGLPLAARLPEHLRPVEGGRGIGKHPRGQEHLAEQFVAASYPGPGRVKRQARDEVPRLGDGPGPVSAAHGACPAQVEARVGAEEGEGELGVGVDSPLRGTQCPGRVTGHRGDLRRPRGPRRDRVGVVGSGILHRVEQVACPVEVAMQRHDLGELHGRQQLLVAS